MKIIVPALAFCAVLFVYWCGGGDFDRDDQLQRYVILGYMAAAVTFFAVITYPKGDSE